MSVCDLDNNLSFLKDAACTTIKTFSSTRGGRGWYILRLFFMPHHGRCEDACCKTDSMLQSTNSPYLLSTTCELARLLWKLSNPFCRVPDREQQRQQAIRDLEALLEPGAIEDWITQVGGLGVSSNLQESFVQMSPGMYKYHLTLRT